MRQDASWSILARRAGQKALAGQRSIPREDSEMGLQSLRDKLLQAGLVSEDQAKKAEADRAAKPTNRESAPPRREGAPPRRESAPPRRDGAPPRREGAPQRREGAPAPQRAQAARPARPQERQEKQAKPAKELTPEQQKAREEEAAFAERERMLNREREDNRKRAVEDRKRLEGVRAAAERFEVTERGGEAFFFTTRKKKVQRIYLTAEQLQRLESGDLAIIDKPLPAELSFSLVTREGAERALALDPKALRFYNRGFGQTFGFKAESSKFDENAEADAAEGEEAEAAEVAPASNEAETEAAEDAPASDETQAS
ncbi:DUF2058 family protein [Vulgatibacter incomptus]|nr:DUF2058 family protein [Vulgatibacter incomptus]